MSIEKVWPSGAWRVSDIINGRLVSFLYFGMTRKEALEQFKVDSL